MKKLILMIALGAITGAALAQETDTEATKVAFTTNGGVTLSQGEFDSLILEQGGQKITAPKVK